VTTYLCVYLGSLLLALLATPVVIWLARRIGAVDQPDIRTVRERPIPQPGQGAILLSAMSLIVSVIFRRNDIGEAVRTVRFPSVTLLCSATFVFLVGLMEDLKGRPARCEFVAEPLAAALRFAGVRISEIACTDPWVRHSLLVDEHAGYRSTIAQVSGQIKHRRCRRQDGCKGNTVGEKDFQEFTTESAVPEIRRFRSMGMTKSASTSDGEQLERFSAKIGGICSTKEWTNHELVDLFNGIIPEFQHTERNKNLDDRME
jgi:hypothetical protein